jgi:ankyrin repeat protein/anthranilate/para-aminobenzoate synthase component II
MWQRFIYSANLKDKLGALTKEELSVLDENGYSLLSYALYHKDTDFVEYLLRDLKLDPRQQAYSGYYKFGIKSPMWKAALSSWQHVKEKVALLHKYSSDLDTLDEAGYSLLSYALYHKDTDLVEYLLRDLKLDPKQQAYSGDHIYVDGKLVQSKSPMWKAALSSQQHVKEKVALLHKYGSDLDTLDDNGMSALTFRMSTGQSIAVLLGYTDLNKKAYGTLYKDDDDDQETPLSIAIDKEQVNNAIMLIEAGANITAKDKTGSSAIHDASLKGLFEVVKLLLDKGANVNEADKFGITPLYFAIFSLDIETIRLLINKGADKSAKITSKYITFSIGHAIIASVISSVLDTDDDESEKIAYSGLKSVLLEFPEAVTSANYAQLIQDLKNHFVNFINDIAEIVGENFHLPENLLGFPVAVAQIKLVEQVFSLLMDYIDSYNNCVKSRCEGNLLPLEFYAAINGDSGLLMRLFKTKPELVNSVYKDISLFETTVLFNHLDTAKIILRHSNFDLNTKDLLGNNVLANIIPLKDLSLVQSLLETGVNIDAVNHNFVSAADKILHQFGDSNYTEAVSIVRQYTKDPMHKLSAMGQEYQSYNFESNKAYVGIVTAGGFWSVEHFSTARKAMTKHNQLQMLVINPEQIDQAFLRNFNGFIMPGGGDSYPKNKEFTMVDLPEDKMLAGEKLYKLILSLADKYSIPVMGMCLGNQYIGLHSGATLHAVKNHFGGNHKGIFIKGTMPYFMSLSTQEQHQLLNNQYWPDIEFGIDTAHSFAVVTNKAGIATVGTYSEVGVVESLSYKNHMIGFQFHPEHYYGILNSDQTIRSNNLINNFLTLTTQHHQWHYFANIKGFKYEDAQNALSRQNDKLMDLVAESVTDHCLPLDCYSQDQKTIIFPVCNTTNSEFSWPSPKLEAFVSIGYCEIPTDICKRVVSEDTDKLPDIYVGHDTLADLNGVCSRDNIEN